MNVTWSAVYNDGEEFCSDHVGTANIHCMNLGLNLSRIEQRWNGHWLRPCVGMRADQASHEWTPRLVGPYGTVTFEDILEPRHD